MYPCEECHRSYSRRDNLKRHVVSVHGNKIRGVMDPLIAYRSRPTINSRRNDINLFGFGIRPDRRSFAGSYHLNEKKESQDNRLKWKHPFTCIIAGPTSCGKSSFTARFLKHLDNMINTDISEIFYCAPESSYPDLSESQIPVRYLDWLPKAEMFADKKNRLVIIDDMMRESDESVVDLFTKHSHHFSASVIFICQNIFHRGKGQRDISLNSHYIVGFKSPRDRTQISSLARQISPGNTAYINEIFEDATKNPYGYLLLDLTQTTPDHLRYRTNIFPDDKPNFIYVPKNYPIENMKSRNQIFELRV